MMFWSEKRSILSRKKFPFLDKAKSIRALLRRLGPLRQDMRRLSTFLFSSFLARHQSVDFCQWLNRLHGRRLDGVEWSLRRFSDWPLSASYF